VSSLTSQKFSQHDAYHVTTCYNPETNFHPITQFLSDGSHCQMTTSPFDMMLVESAYNFIQIWQSLAQGVGHDDSQL
jgi:hypothetical protein